MYWYTLLAICNQKVFCNQNYPQPVLFYYSFLFASDRIVSLVEEKGSNDEILELLRNSHGLLHEACNQESVTSVKILLAKGVSTSEWNRVSHSVYKVPHVGGA